MENAGNGSRLWSPSTDSGAKVWSETLLLIMQTSVLVRKASNGSRPQGAFKKCSAKVRSSNITYNAAISACEKPRQLQQTLDLFVRMLGGLPFLAAMVRTSKRAAYKTRRWAPLRPSASAILCAAKAPGLTHGAVLRSIIVARIFAVTSSRLGTWDTPCSKSDYNDRTKKTYRPFGHRSYEQYVELFGRTLAAFTSDDVASRLGSVVFTAANPLTMGFASRLLGRSETGIAWSTHIVLNDFACIVGAHCVSFDAIYEKASACGKGVPVPDEHVEIVRQRLNSDRLTLA